MSTTPCLTEDELLAFADGALSAQDAARANAHLADCSTCRAVLATIAKDPSRASPALIEQGVGDATPLRRGMSLGRYLVLDCIGSGGMGVVYTAYDPELDRRVAVKLLRQTSEVPSSRLQHEARAMARLNHRNVAAVFDVGTFEGRVFLAMEFLTGETLRRWLETDRTVTQVLGVFVQAGQGLAAAHHAGIVHRDFKPDNLMVAPDGRVSVLDFGLARAPSGQSEVSKELQHDAVAGRVAAASVPASQTQTGTVLGTPNYMAPEQRVGGQVDARSDQYSFCVALHEALSGSLPGQPARKSPKLPAVLERALQTGLQVAPDARHRDLDALLAQLELARTPVSSSRTLYGLATAAVLAIVGAAVWSQRTPVTLCTGGEAELQTVWSPAQASALRAAFAELPNGVARANATVGAIDEWAKQWSQMHREACEATRVRGVQSEDLLDRRMLCLNGELVQLQATAGLLSTKGPALDKAGEAVRGLPAVARCANAQALLERVPLPTDPAVKEKYDLAEKAFAEARARRLVARFPEALPLAQTAVTAAEAVGYLPQLARALLQLGEVQRYTGDFTAAGDSVWRGVGEARAGRDGVLEAEGWVLLSDVVGVAQQNQAIGEKLLGQSAAVNRSHPGTEQIETRRLMIAGAFYDTFHRGPEAQAMFEQALARREKEFGPDSVQVAEVLTRLGDMLLTDQKLDESEKAQRRALAIWEKDETLRLSLDRPLASLAYTLGTAKRYDEARPLFQRALDVVQENHSGVLREARVLNYWGAMEGIAGRDDDAEKLYLRAVEGLRTLPAPNPYLGDPLTNLAAVFINRQKFDRAIELAKEAIAAYDQLPQRSPLVSLSAQMSLAESFIGKKDFAAARKEIDRLDLTLAKSDASDASLAADRFSVAQLMAMANQYRMADARKLARRAREATAPIGQPPIDEWLKKNGG